jgi:heme-degrading monooxygenase HmoA
MEPLMDAGYCVRVVPGQVKPGALEGWVARHRERHTPAVRRQPGFVAKLLLQAEADQDRVAMLLVWQSSEQAAAWTRQPEHDAVSVPLREFVVSQAEAPDAGAALGRGGYHVLDAVFGSG